MATKTVKMFERPGTYTVYSESGDRIGIIGRHRDYSSGIAKWKAMPDSAEPTWHRTQKGAAAAIELAAANA